MIGDIDNMQQRPRVRRDGWIAIVLASPFSSWWRDGGVECNDHAHVRSRRLTAQYDQSKTFQQNQDQLTRLPRGAGRYAQMQGELNTRWEAS